MTALSVPPDVAMTAPVRLSELETVIERGLATFVEVGSALMEIRDSRLYRADFGTFEEYCSERWAMKRAHAYRLIEAAETVGHLSPVGDTTPTTERQIRPLTRLEPEQQRVAWQHAVETAPEGRVTAAHVEAVALTVKAAGLNHCDNGHAWMADLPECPYCTMTSTARIAELRESLDHAKRPHVSNNSGNNEWYTPSPFVEAARLAMGSIDTDPASSDIANRTVKAAQYFDSEKNGLAQTWEGAVWLNPPYAQPLISDFCAAVADRYTRGEITQACVLVNNATETAWFQSLLSSATAVCFLRSRVRFEDVSGNPTGSPLQGQAVVYFGKRCPEFAESFAALGKVLYA